MPGFPKLNADYESWLATQCDVDKEGLRKKHERMRKDAFKFLRSTYFRWAGVVEARAPALTSAPVALAVGDLHVENYGTWRDAEGRLVWGVNDFDEAARMPFTFDLLRLGASASLAQDPPLRDDDIASAILDGYRTGLDQPRPVLVEEHSPWLLASVACTEQNCVDFYKAVDGYTPIAPPPEVSRELRKSLPEGAGDPVFSTHQKGGGSLGRPRFFAVSAWRGGKIVREAKAWVPSGWDWAHKLPPQPANYMAVANGRYRSPDPLLKVEGGYVLRRVAPDARKIDLEALGGKLSLRLLSAMASDLAAIHAGSIRAQDLKHDLAARPASWLQQAIEVMIQVTTADYETWKAAAAP